MKLLFRKGLIKSLCSIIDIDYLVFRYYSGFVPNNGFEFNNGLEFPLVEKEGYIYFISRCGETRSFFDFW